MDSRGAIKGRATPEDQIGGPPTDHGTTGVQDRLAAPPSGLWPRARTWVRASPLLVGAIAVGLAARIVFWAVTDRRLDDALITIKFDKNLADGFGLVHNLGDGHVQGFTSALSVLVPLPGELVAPGGGMFLIRVVSLVAFVFAAVYAYRIARELELGPWPTGLVLVYLALDQNQVLFGVAGMETQIAVAVLLGGIYYVLIKDYVKSGVALGLALLARPDFVLWVAPASLFLLIHNPRRALRAGLISAAVLAPWVIFATVYYGSPIPNTIAAKELSFGPSLPSITHLGGWIDFLGHQFSVHVHDWRTFAPFYEAAFAMHAPLSYGLLKAIAVLVAVLAIVGALATCNRPSWLPAIALVALFVLYKVVFLTVGYFEWYGPPALAVLILLAAAGLDRIAVWLAAASRSRISSAQAAAVPAVLLAVVYALPLPYRTLAEARVQHDIEDQVRTPLSQYLGRVVKPGQSITSESSGYVGYDTNGTLYDYPGLESTTVVDALRDAGAGEDPRPPIDSLPGIAKLLHPDWLVLRPWEASGFAAAYPATARQYRPVRRFHVSDASSSLDVGGFDLFNIDRDFTVYRLLPTRAP
jgi:hypothetical protein